MPGLEQRSFAGGIISPPLLARKDTAKVQAGLAACNNFYPTKSGSLENRTGLRFVHEVKSGETAARLERFVFNTDQAYVLEVGTKYLRLYQSGGILLTGSQSDWVDATAYEIGDIVVDGAASGNTGSYFYCIADHTSNGTTNGPHGGASDYWWYELEDEGASAILEIPTPYAAADLADLTFRQSGNFVTITHRNYPPHELVRNGATDWTCLPIAFKPSMAAPTALQNSAGGGGTGSQTYRYKVTAIRRDTLEESLGAPNNTGVAGVSATFSGTTDIIVTHTAHGLATGDEVYIEAVDPVVASNSNTNAILALKDTVWSITVVTANTFALDESGGMLTQSAGVPAFAFFTLDYAVNYDEYTGKASNFSANPITIQWTGVADAKEYWVYRSTNKGPYGFLEATKQTSYEDDDDVEPDLEITAPVYRNPFRFPDWPRTTGYHGQRQVFAGTGANPQKVWMSRTADFRDFTTRTPVVNDDSLEFTIAAQQANEIQAVVSLGQIIFLTSGALWTALGDADGVILPTSINLQALSYEGANLVAPLLIKDSVLFVDVLESVVRELRFDIAAGGYSGYVPEDLTVFAPDLFRGHTVVDWAYASVPEGVAWVVRDDGVLLGLTFLKEHEVSAWSTHTTGTTDKFKSVTTIPEDGRDAIYAIVERTIDGSTVYYVEVQESRRVGYASTDNRETIRFLDSMLTYDGTNTDGSTTMTLTGGTTWAAGETGLTITRSAGTFSGSNVGNGLRLSDAAGNEVEAEITADPGTSAVTVTLLTAAPLSLRGGASTTAWVLMVDDVSGLDHLEAATVGILADGNDLGTDTIASGAITTLDRPYGLIHVGLPIPDARVELLDVDMAAAAEGVRDVRKRVVRAEVQVVNTLGLQGGIDSSELYDLRPEQAPSDSTALLTGLLPIRMGSRWNEPGTVVLQQSSPLPATITGVIRVLEVGRRTP